MLARTVLAIALDANSLRSVLRSQHVFEDPNSVAGAVELFAGTWKDRLLGHHGKPFNMEPM